MSEPQIGNAELGTVAIFVESEIGTQVANALAAAGVTVGTVDVRGDLPIADVQRALADARTVVDMIALDLTAKRNAVATFDSYAPSSAALVSYALTASTTEIASWSTRPERVAGFGFLPPLADVKVLEVAPGLQTGGAALSAAQSLVAALGKESAVVADGAGLVSARILAPIINEAAFALMEGVATAQDIDTAVKLGVNYPHGPLEWADLIGIDLVYSIIRALHAEQGEDRYRPCPLLRKLVLAGWTGQAAGRGFFTYPP
jgi:3-hydroxybutyryl-CoA dehydrogenase